MALDLYQVKINGIQHTLRLSAARAAEYPGAKKMSARAQSNTVPGTKQTVPDNK